jgi:ATP-dependent exoDNAse (exonuclease V) alpha subunit
MHPENDYDKEVYNGDIGYTNDVDPDAGEIVVLRWPVRHLWVRRTERAGAGLRCNDP